MSAREMAPLITKMEMEKSIQKETVLEAGKLLTTSTESDIDLELQDFGPPPQLTKPETGGYFQYNDDSDDGENLHSSQETAKVTDADVDLEMQDLAPMPNNPETNGNSQSPQADALDEPDIPGNRLANAMDSTLDVRVQPLKHNRNNVFVRQSHYTWELLFCYFLYFFCVILAFGYAAYYVVVPIFYAIYQKSHGFNKTMKHNHSI